MARPTIEVPWTGVVFPQKCASCGHPMVERTVPIKASTEAQQRRQTIGHFLFGIIGVAIASAGRGGDSIQFDVPYCEECAAKERRLRMTAGIVLALGLVALLVLLAIYAGMNSVRSWISVSGYLGVLLVGAAVVLFSIQGSLRAVTIKAVKDQFSGAVLSFRSPEYLDEFRQANLPALVAYDLQAGLPLPVSPEQAVRIVSQNIDDDRPDAPDTLTGHYHRALIYTHGEDYSRAVDDLSKVIAVGGNNPFLPEAFFLRGQSLLNLARYQEAATDLEAFIHASTDLQKVGAAKKLLKKVSAYR